MKPPETAPWPRLPLWFAAAAALAFLVLGIVLFERDWRREKDYLEELYLWRGEAIIHALEVLGRIQPEEPWAEARLQSYWDNLAEDEEQALFIALTDSRGRLTAAAGRLTVPPELTDEAPPAGPLTAEFFRPRRRVETIDGRRVALVHRVFRDYPRWRQKWRERNGRHHREPAGPGAEHRPDKPELDQALWPQVWVGFDLMALDRLGAARARSAAVSIGLFCLAGLGAVLAMFAGHNARLARRMYQEVKAELAHKERLAALGNLAAGLAHEIRNPLGAISGLCQHLLDRGSGEARDREALEVMSASVKRLNQAVTDFLNYARPLEMKAKSLDLGLLVRRTAVLAAHDARARAVELKLDLPTEPLWMEGDEALLAQAFLNLYLNAIEAAGSAPGGGRLAVALKKAGRQARLTFRDNGPGFSPAQLARPFTPFFTTKAEGMGLGLALVEKAVRAHPGGSVTLNSPPAGGASVTLTFGLAAPAETGAPPKD